MEWYVVGKPCPNPDGCGHMSHRVADRGFVKESHILWYDLTCNKCNYPWVEERSA